jgi:hypothetical protein
MNYPTIAPHWDCPQELKFVTEVEGTEVPNTKRLIKVHPNGSREVAAYVGAQQGFESHIVFFGEVVQAIKSRVSEHEFASADVKWQHSHNGLFVVLDIRFPSISNTFQYRDQQDVVEEWTKSLRLIVVRSINGKAATSAFFGDIDWFCLNTLISGNFEGIRQKNTINFNPVSFANRIPVIKDKFLENARIEQEYSKIKVIPGTTTKLFEELFPLPPKEDGELSKPRISRKVEEFQTLYEEEAQSRGPTLYSVLSAFSRYSAHKPLKTKVITKWNTNAFNNHKRELEVQKMMRSEPWNEFLLTHHAPALSQSDLH